MGEEWMDKCPVTIKMPRGAAATSVHINLRFANPEYMVRTQRDKLPTYNLQLSRLLTASIGSNQSVPPAVVQLNPSVAKQLNAVEGDGEVMDMNVPRRRVGRKNASH